MKTLQFINIFLLTLVAGVLWGTWFSLSRSIATITPGTFLEVGRIMIGNLAWPMSILMPAAMLSTFPVLFMMFRRNMMLAFFLASAGLLLFVVVLVVTLTVNVPIDNQIKQWTVTTLPADWQAIRDRWEFYHGLRTFASLAGLACVFGSVLRTH
ncbi:MAG TPA: anthrone oxygenase family protein [Pyrinomonadaceae bacterium]|nr:anthrone oxygenase family protein [Pyrinomonadaceae bacterium]